MSEAKRPHCPDRRNAPAATVVGRRAGLASRDHREMRGAAGRWFRAAGPGSRAGTIANGSGPHGEAPPAGTIARCVGRPSAANEETQ